jgi:hypothetical protein
MSGTENLRHWSALEKTDPAHTRPFNRGRFQGTATRPIYHEQRLTEHFGPCGIGWGMGKPEFTLIPARDELVVYCTVMLWYRDGETRGESWGVGGDKVLAQQSSGPFINDEAYKSAYTDALGNAMKHIGVGADVHMNRFTDSKYVRDLREEFGSEPEAPQRPAGEPSRPPAPNGAAKPFLAQIRSAAVGTAHPRYNDAVAAKKRMMASIDIADTPNLIDDIFLSNEPDLRLINEVSPKSYDDLMSNGASRKLALVAGKLDAAFTS